MRFADLTTFTSEDISRFPDQTAYKLNRLQERVQQLWAYLYPVGSYYETSDTDFDPNTHWGGTWEKVGARWHRTA